MRANALNQLHLQTWRLFESMVHPMTTSSSLSGADLGESAVERPRSRFDYCFKVAP